MCVCECVTCFLPWPAGPLCGHPLAGSLLPQGRAAATAVFCPEAPRALGPRWTDSTSSAQATAGGTVVRRGGGLPHPGQSSGAAHIFACGAWGWAVWLRVPARLFLSLAPRGPQAGLGRLAGRPARPSTGQLVGGPLGFLPIFTGNCILFLCWFLVNMFSPFPLLTYFLTLTHQIEASLAGLRAWGGSPALMVGWAGFPSCPFSPSGVLFSAPCHEHVWLLSLLELDLPRVLGAAHIPGEPPGAGGQVLLLKAGLTATWGPSRLWVC